MLSQADDFKAEADELYRLLVTLDAAQWDHATLFKAWTVNDIVQHLHDGDLMAAASVAGPEVFAKFRERLATFEIVEERLEWHPSTQEH